MDLWSPLTMEKDHSPQGLEEEWKNKGPIHDLYPHGRDVILRVNKTQL